MGYLKNFSCICLVKLFAIYSLSCADKNTNIRKGNTNDRNNNNNINQPIATKKEEEIKNKLSNTTIKNTFDNLIKSKEINITKIDPNNSMHIEVIRLICVQKLNFSKIINEVTTKPQKTGHWIWWVYTTSKPGDSDSYKVKIDNNTLMLYLEVVPLDIFDNWKLILNTINTKFNTNKNFLPPIDHGRLPYSSKLWLNSPSAPTFLIATKRYKEVKNIFTVFQNILNKHNIK